MKTFGVLLSVAFGTVKLLFSTVELYRTQVSLVEFKTKLSLQFKQDPLISQSLQFAGHSKQSPAVVIVNDELLQLKRYVYILVPFAITNMPFFTEYSASAPTGDIDPLYMGFALAGFV